MIEFIPINLCIIAYKITKVLAKRLKGVLDSIVSSTQSAFILGRLINDNILVAFEVMHFLKSKTKGKEGFHAYKLDLCKAYN